MVGRLTNTLGQDLNLLYAPCQAAYLNVKKRKHACMSSLAGLGCNPYTFAKSDLSQPLGVPALVFAAEVSSCQTLCAVKAINRLKLLLLL